jgi:2-polyprenyl-3-methyl-5-hydroxy-6-metoxy-1,4-benzoquinol methylase
VPLSLRKRAVLGLQRQTWLDQRRRDWWAVELVRDLAERDVDAFHQFLWTHHLAYAESYEVEQRFGPENVKTSRKMFFSDLCLQLDEMPGLGRDRVRSVFEVGCSLGYQLRSIETDLFPAATRVEGLDIDAYAIEAGAKYLTSVGSKVKLQCADTRDIDRVLGGHTYDVIVCTGVLMYLNKDAAGAVVRSMLQHTRLLALSGLAHPNTDNAGLKQPDTRASDQTFVHNFDEMVAKAGGRVVRRRWEGSNVVDGNTIYFVFATP